MDIELKQKVVTLRKQGKTYNEIRSILGPIPKSSLSNWLKHIELTQEQKQSILQKMKDGAELGRQKGGFTNHQKRLDRIKNIQIIASKEFQKHQKDPLFIGGIILYLAEGSKTRDRFQFMNSDVYLNKFMLNWVIRFGNIAKQNIQFRLYAHRTYEEENCEEYWSQQLDVSEQQFKKTVFKWSPHTIKRNPLYKGCLRMELNGSLLYWKIMKWRDMLYTDLG